MTVAMSVWSQDASITLAREKNNAELCSVLFPDDSGSTITTIGSSPLVSTLKEEETTSLTIASPHPKSEAPVVELMVRSPACVAYPPLPPIDEESVPVTLLADPYKQGHNLVEEDCSSTADETEESETILIETPPTPVSVKKTEQMRNSDPSIQTTQHNTMNYQEEKKEDDAETTSAHHHAETEKAPSEKAEKAPLELRTTRRTAIKPRKLSEYIRRDLWKRGDPDTVHAALHMLSAAATRPEARGSIARTGGLLAIVRAMEDYVTHPQIQIAACQALEKLALDAENEMAIAEIGGVDAVLGAMMCHFDDCAVHEAAWSTLWNLTCLNSADTMTIDTAGGMAAIVSCMKHHALHAKVQQNACGALRNLCLHHEERLQALVEAGGLVAIASALQTHWKHPAVRKEASYALAVLLEPQFTEDGDV
jgi:hypothetical protein